MLVTRAFLAVGERESTQRESHGSRELAAANKPTQPGRCSCFSDLVFLRPPREAGNTSSEEVAGNTSSEEVASQLGDWSLLSDPRSKRIRLSFEQLNGSECKSSMMLASRARIDSLRFCSS